jgi:hypothetical protein
LAPFFLFIVRHPKVVFVEYSPKQKLTKSLTSSCIDNLLPFKQQEEQQRNYNFRAIECVFLPFTPHV